MTKATAHQRTAGVMDRCCFQCCRCGPNSRECRSAAWSLGEERAKQAAASSRNGVVGRPGSSSPRAASAVVASPAAIRAGRRIACQAAVPDRWEKSPVGCSAGGVRRWGCGTEGLSASVGLAGCGNSVDFRDVGDVDKTTSAAWGALLRAVSFRLSVEFSATLTKKTPQYLEESLQIRIDPVSGNRKLRGQPDLPPACVFSGFSADVSPGTAA